MEMVPFGKEITIEIWCTRLKRKLNGDVKIVYEPEENIGVLATYNSFFLFYLAKKTWTIIEGIEYAFFDVYLFVFDCKIDANTFLPIFFHF